jgi:hypothetical protein
VQDWVVNDASDGYALSDDAGVGVTQIVSQTLVVMVVASQLPLLDCE